MCEKCNFCFSCQYTHSICVPHFLGPHDTQLCVLIATRKYPQVESHPRWTGLCTVFTLIAHFYIYKLIIHVEVFTNTPLVVWGVKILFNLQTPFLRGHLKSLVNMHGLIQKIMVGGAKQAELDYRGA